MQTSPLAQSPGSRQRREGHDVQRTWRHGLLTAVLLSLAMFGVSLLGTWAPAYDQVAGHRIVNSLSYVSDLGTPFWREIAFYLVALFALHALLGVCAHVLALLAEAAYGAPVRGRRMRAGAWLAAGFAWALLANSAWFPASIFASGPWTVGAKEVAGIRVADAAGLLLVAAAMAVALGAVRHSLRGVTAHRWTSAAAAVLLAAIAGGCAMLLRGQDVERSARYDRPHVVVIGIDSLRCDVTALGDGASLTPHIDAFKRTSTQFTDAITPLARTFPAWVSVLTGKSPRATNARFNLMPRVDVREGESLGDALQALGYDAVYATDEVRFANIDESYGFGKTITPPMGATDFVLGTFNDLPWPNIVSNTPLGRWLFPHTYANRAAHVTYDPRAFIDRLDAELDVEGPTFLAVHLTLAHWPYSWAGRDKPTVPQAFRSMYRESVSEVDQQFERLRLLLERKGLLENAIVVVLSDHGEALGKPGDTYLRGFASSDAIWNSVWGHGTSVLSPHQFTVMLSFSRFGARPFHTAGTRLDVPASLEDVRPTILDLLGAPVGEGLTGSSLRGVLEGRPADAKLAARIRFTETDFNTDLILQGKYDEKGVLQEGAQYYTLDPRSGWVELRRERLRELLDKKERAAITSTHLLAAVPYRRGGGLEYILVDRRQRFPMRLTARPDEREAPEPARLWDALHREFAGEIPQANVPPG
jgi:arylsulfatase A-like enzyme